MRKNSTDGSYETLNQFKLRYFSDGKNRYNIKIPHVYVSHLINDNSMFFHTLGLYNANKIFNPQNLGVPT